MFIFLKNITSILKMKKKNTIPITNSKSTTSFTTAFEQVQLNHLTWLILTNNMVNHPHKSNQLTKCLTFFLNQMNVIKEPNWKQEAR